ncbi:MAG: GHKL domain-containing protein [Lachnospiraceae bacterium]|nr:GHKL domain-containing protein [Lachnospiraceae bacterium]
MERFDLILSVFFYIIEFVLTLGLFVLMFSTREAILRFRAMKKTQRVFFVVSLHAFLAASVILKMPVLMIVFQVAVLINLGRDSRILKNCIEGYAAIGLRLITEIGLGHLLYSHDQASEGLFYGTGQNEHIVLVMFLLVLIQLALTMVIHGYRNRHAKEEFQYTLNGIHLVIEGFWLFSISALVRDRNTFYFFLSTFLLMAVKDYYALYRIERCQEERTEEARRISIPANREEYYTSMEEEHQQIRRLYHDMKNSFMVMENRMIDNEEEKALLKKKTEQLLALERHYHTGCRTLDILLFESSRRAKERGVEFEVIIQEDCLHFMDDDDINAIFVNAIVNALEACEKVEEGKRKILIRAGKKGNEVMISFKNSMNPEEKNNNLETTKKNKRSHGIGLPSIQRAADHYGGFMTVEQEEGTFHLALLFLNGQMV